MALSLKDPETDRLARAVAATTGETLTEAVRTALAERLVREELRRGANPRLAEQLESLGHACMALPDLDLRSTDELAGVRRNRPVALMVIDTSAVVAILFGEPGGKFYGETIAAAGTRLISAVTRVELACVIEGRKGEAGRTYLEQFLALTGTETMPVTRQQAELAIDGFRRFGKGRHRASLNMGDCFSYALAQASGMPLLFKGDDFGHTDVRVAGIGAD